MALETRSNPVCAHGYGPGDHHFESGWCHDGVTAAQASLIEEQRVHRV